MRLHAKPNASHHRLNLVHRAIGPHIRPFHASGLPNGIFALEGFGDTVDAGNDFYGVT